MDSQVEVAVLEMRRLHPGWGPRRIVFEVAKAGTTVSESGVYRALRRANLIDPSARRRRSPDWKRWERGQPMELWQMDVVGGIGLRDGTSLKCLTGVDDHSRFCVCAALLVKERTQLVCDAFAAGLRTHGVPEQILTDNGKVFTGRFNHPPTEVLFDRICRENGIEHLLTQPRSPTTTGKIERFHRTLRTEFLSGRMFTSLEAAQCELDAWVISYNTARPHQSLNMHTPAERFAAGHDQVPGPPMDTTAIAQDRSGDDWISRSVSVNGVISVSNQVFSVGKHRSGSTVDVRVRQDLLEVWDGMELVKTVLRTSQGVIRKKKAEYHHRH
jgi:transposase InsO family protein